MRKLETPKEEYMQLAIKSAIQGITKGEGGPFGACIVSKDGKVISIAHNTVFKSCDSTAHAEVNAIRKACKKLKSLNLSGCTIYSTTEPCPMCFSAIHWARISTIIYGTTISDAARYGFNEIKVRDIQLKHLGRLKINIIPSFMRKECLQLFERWKMKGGRPY
ncbi:MAG: nucleoside deaminase [Candidatus Micrarchaeia archaeon]